MPSLVATVRRVISLSKVMNSSTMTRGRSPRMLATASSHASPDLRRLPGHGLALARARHDRLDDARQADVVSRGDRLVAALGEAVLGSDEPELARGEVADAVAVHGQLDGLGRGRDPPAFGFELRPAHRCRSLRSRERSRRAGASRPRPGARRRRASETPRMRRRAALPGHRHSDRRRSPGSRGAWQRSRTRGRARPSREA